MINHFHKYYILEVEPRMAQMSFDKIIASCRDRGTFPENGPITILLLVTATFAFP